MDRPAAPATVFGPANTQHPQACRHVVQHLTDRLADPVYSPTTAGAEGKAEVESHTLARQMVGEARPFVGGGGSFFPPASDRRQLRADAGNVCIEILEP